MHSTALQSPIKKLARLADDNQGHFTYLTGKLPTLPNDLLDICREWKEEEINLDLRSTEVADTVDIVFSCYPFKFTLLTLILPWCNESFKPAVALLLDKGIEVNLGDIFFLVRNEIAFNGLKPLINQILERFDIKQINNTIHTGNTILHEIAKLKKKYISWELVDFLLDHGANVNIKNEAVDTPLHVAFQRRNIRLFFKYLLSNSDLTIENAQGVCLLDLLKKFYQIDGKIIEKAAQYAVDDRDDQHVNEAIFREVIAQFLNQHELKNIADIFLDERSYKPLTRSLFSNAKIIHYLMRPMSFDKREYPDYLDLECAFYEAASQPKKNTAIKKSLVLIPYRSDVEEHCHANISAYEKNMKPSARFYARGTGIKLIEKQFDLIKKSFPEWKQYFQLIIPKRYKTGIHLDLLAESSSLECNERGYAYVISATQQGGHVFSVLSLIQVKIKKVQCHIVIDSEIDGNYGFINNKVGAQEVPIFESGLFLQQEKEDGNCGLYTIQICKAVYALLHDNPVLQQKLELLALSDNHWENIRSHFQDGLKEQMPEFFFKNKNQEYVLHPYQRVKQYHLEKRWQMSNQIIFFRHNRAKKQIQQENVYWKIIAEKFPMLKENEGQSKKIG